MNKITKLALAAPAVAAIVGILVFTQVRASALAASQDPTATGTPAAQSQVQQPCAPGFDQGQGQRPGRGGRGGPDGKVTAISADSLTMTGRQSETYTVTVSSQTSVTLMTTQAQGSLSDIKVGDNVRVMGRPSSNNTVAAQQINVYPAGDRAGGPVSAINGSAITVQNPQGTLTINTDSSTQFFLSGKAGSLSDVTAGKFVEAFGTTQSDGSLKATYVLINDQPARGMHMGGGPQGPGQPPATNGTQAPTNPVPAPDQQSTSGSA